MRARIIVFRTAAVILAISMAVIVCPKPGVSYKLSPRGTVVERQIAKQYSDWFQRILAGIAGQGVQQFTQAVHEEITERIYGCEGEESLCGNVDSDYASPYVLAGVRWNDDPPFQLLQGQAKGTACKTTETIRFTTQPQCWDQLFRQAEQRASNGEMLDANSKAPLLMRSHYGDLQFLHAMASHDGETASETERHIIMWAEFTWKTSRGDYALDTKLQDVTIEGFDQFFGRYNWRVQELFALGNPVLRSWVKEVAFGSLLHMVEDSFAKGHAQRENFGATCPGASSQLAPGVIDEFHSYSHQDPHKHAQYDSRDAFVEQWEQAKPNVVEVGRVLQAYHTSNTIPSWNEVKPYIDCIFTIADPQAQASAGDEFKRND